MSTRRFPRPFLSLLITSSTLVARAAGAADGDVLFHGVTLKDAGGTKGDTVAAMVVRPDGKILQLGTVVTGAGTWAMALARFHPSGALDTDFGSGGWLVDPFALGLNSWGNALHLLPYGRILIGGTVDLGGGDHDFVIGCLEANGIPNELFGVSGDGYTYESFGSGVNGTDDLAALTADRFGRIVSVGTVDSGATDTDIGVSRLTATGVWDDSFSGNGQTKLALAAAGGADLGLAVTIDPFDRIIVGGATWTSHDETGSNFDSVLAALDSNGDPDSSFGAGGVYKTDLATSGNYNDYVFDVDAWPDGEIVAAGDWSSGTDRWAWFVFALAPGGFFDLATGTYCGDMFFPCTNGPQDSARSLVLEGDGKVVVGGFGRGPGGTIDFAVTRLTRNLDPDNSFASDSTTTYDFDWGAGTDADVGTALALAHDGRILLGGSVEFGGLDTDFGLLELESSYIFADGVEGPGGWANWSSVTP